MASDLKPAFAYTIVYVKDVAKPVEFYAKAFGYNVRRLDESHRYTYAKAFGYNVRRLDESHRWGELESGQTTTAFTGQHQHETDDLTGVVQVPKSDRERPPTELCLVYSDVDAAFKRAVENGAVLVSQPENKQDWGHRVGYVRDIDGMTVRNEGGKLCSPTKTRLNGTKTTKLFAQEMFVTFIKS